MDRDVRCIVCPVGCTLRVSCALDDAGKVVSVLGVAGGKCERGKAYAEAEVTNPCRILTTTIPSTIAGIQVVPVRTSKPVPITLLFDCVAAINRACLAERVHIGHLVIRDILGTGADVVTTRELLDSR